MSRFYLAVPLLSPDLVVQGETLDGVTQMLGDSGLETIKTHGGFLFSFTLLDIALALDLVELISLTDLNCLPVQGFEKTPTRLLTCVFRSVCPCYEH